MHPSQLAQFYLERGHLFIQSDQIQKAIESYEAGLRYQPGNLGLLKTKALAHFDIEDYQGALKAFRDCLRVDSGKEDSVYFLMIGECLYNLRKFSQAYRFFGKFQKRLPRSVEGYIRKGKTLLAQGKVKQAMVHFQKAIIQNAYCPRSNYFMASCHFFQRAYRKAIPYLNAAIANNRGCGDYYVMKGHCHYNLCEFDKAEICYEEVVGEIGGGCEYQAREALAITKFRLSGKCFQKEGFKGEIQGKGAEKEIWDSQKEDLNQNMMKIEGKPSKSCNRDRNRKKESRKGMKKKG